jgi:hypothetical protein
VLPPCICEMVLLRNSGVAVSIVPGPVQELETVFDSLLE